MKERNRLVIRDLFMFGYNTGHLEVNPNAAGVGDYSRKIDGCSIKQ